jgi:hypothetical protein
MEGKMAEELPTLSEHLLTLNRRDLLSTAVGFGAASRV